MFTAAMIIYGILAFITGPFWPLEVLSGKAGCLGQILGILWGALFIAGLSS